MAIRKFLFIKFGGVISFGTAKVRIPRKVFSAKIIFCKSFLPRKFYTIGYSILLACPTMIYAPPVHSEMSYWTHIWRLSFIIDSRVVLTLLSMLLPNWNRKTFFSSAWSVQGGRRNPRRPLTFNDMYPQQCMVINSNVCLHFFTFTLMTTGAFC